MRRVVVLCAAFALCGALHADDKNYEARVKEIHANPAPLSEKFSEEDVQKIIGRLDTYLTTYNHCINDLDPAVAENDPLCEHAIEELDIYLDEIIPNGDKALLETSM